MDHEAISEEKVVKERVVIVGDAGRKCFELSILIGSKRILRH